MPPDDAEAALDAALLAAHAAGDRGLLVNLYTKAADMRTAQGRADAAAFHLVQAYVCALEAGSPQAPALHARLKEQGREE